MATASLTRRITFAAAHRYRRPDWDDARNTEIFGACANPNYHGHTYVCDVTVSGPIHAMTGMVVDLGILDRILSREVREMFDHKTINLDVAEFAEGKLIPTGENLARYIAGRVQSALAKENVGGTARVSSVRLAEDDTLSSMYEP